MKNEILDELWKVKDQVAHESEYNIDKLAEKLRNKEKKEQRPIINLTSQTKFVNDKT
jgi:hypothetical protein